MLVVLLAGIDMSVSAVVLLGVVIIVRNHSDAWAIVVAVLISLAVGLVNGMVIALRRVPAFIATFAMLILLGGIELVYTQGTAGGSVPGWVHTLGSKDLGGLPLPLIVWLALAAAIAAVLHLTVAGRWVYAIGTNSEAARFSGVPVGRVRVCCYVACSLLAFLGGIVLAGYSGYVDQTLGNGVNLNSIAAVVIGGIAFAGGQGRVTGAISGVLVIVLANTIVVLAGLSIYWQYIVSGLVLILAVVMQSLGNGSGPRLNEWLREVATFRR
jgi:ribose transport system permease protein